MRFKVDENLPVETAEVLRQEGFNAATVAEKGIKGATDPTVIEMCQKESRTLITLDTDFADIRSYPPEKYNGLVVLRLKRQDKRHVLEIVSRIVELLPKEQLKGRLWIVEESLVRIRGKEE